MDDSGKTEESRKPEDSRKTEDTRKPDAVPTASIEKNAAGVGASGFVEKIYEGKAQTESPTQARRTIIDEATFKVSEEVTIALIGENRYKKNKSMIVDKIFRQAGRYIPVIKTGELVQGTEGQKLSVTLQVNTSVLEKLLQEQGVLYDNENAPMMIPFIAVVDQVRGESYRWWAAGSAAPLKSVSDYIETQLQKTLFGMGFYVQRPDAAGMRNLIPAGFQYENLTVEQIKILANRWNVPLALGGDLTIRKESTGEVIFDLQMSVTQVDSGRLLAQLSRQNKLGRNETLENLNLKKSLSFVTQAYRDLGQQMAEAWQRGVLTSTLVKLELKGPLPINKYGPFKEALKNSNRAIRWVRERMISSQGVLFELEINGNPTDLKRSLSQVTAGDLSFRLQGGDEAGTLVLVPSLPKAR